MEKPCLIEAMNASNAGDDYARHYMHGKLESTHPVRPGQMGELVECDRCLSAFRLKAGGVYLEADPDCATPSGRGLRRNDYVINIDYSQL